ncbi:hypothetical protein NDQ53_21695 [Rossellomorea marisflavi]|uniref:hypothetical protein n=1 Tax=Rossellomorea marisflavi TaxID=189381 RepID=UPI00203EEBD5|nr:hypothetical protein [Rossellomorea marisflavi]MCM2591902.1 hypothetical protein [Rossellomorea marisflavi]
MSDSGHSSKSTQCSAAEATRLLWEKRAGETLQAQLKRLTVHPAGKRTAAAERNEPFSHPH